VLPTGYTSDIYDNKPVTFREFALQCARNFGALITMRDDPFDAPIPDEFKPSDYHQRRLVELRTELDRLVAWRNMQSPQIDQMINEEFEKNLEAHKETWKRKEQLKGRYLDMLEQVQRWIPPSSDHQNLKQFMLDQLNESLEFDTRHISTPPVRKGREEWLKERINTITREIEYHRRENQAEEERARKRTEWVRLLKESLR
jgi:hypothetical protein